MAEVKFEHVTKEFEDKKVGKVAAVKDSTFTVDDKEFVVFVGPSGCGKSTSLRMLAGLETVTDGKISIDGRVVNKLHPKERDIAMVFQDYALYPHMTVFENMSFGLRNLKTPEAEIKEKVNNAAKILNIENLLDRRPRELSGGQRQRVAVGRTIVRNPKVFLFDEPLSNLDAKLRVQMRVEIAELHKKLQATIIYVTHDQVEAMTLGHRIVVMNYGVIQQYDTPDELYNHPKNMFVAGFIGAPPMNFIKGNIEGNTFVSKGIKFIIPDKFVSKCKPYNGKEVVLGIRPEDIYKEDYALDIARTNMVDAKIKVVEKLGSENLLHFDEFGTTVTAKVAPVGEFQHGMSTKLIFNLEKMHIFDINTENNIF